MHHQELRAHCLSHPAAEETVPFGPGVLVYKVMGKMFALLPDEVAPGENATISLKVAPHLGELLRESFAGVAPGYHLNKQHWITVTMGGDVPDDETRALIAQSYELVVKGLTRAQRAELQRATAADAKPRTAPTP